VGSLALRKVAQLEMPADVVLRAAELARGAGVAVVLDPAPAQPVDSRLLALSTVVRPNRGEARAITG
jgi:ribokinase